MTSRFDPSSIWADAQSASQPHSHRTGEVDRVLTETYRAEWGRLLSLLIARSRRLDLAEDALGEAFARAADRWADVGVPNNPSGWLYSTAWRLVLAGLRSEAIHQRKAPLLTVRPDWNPAGERDDPDDLDRSLGDERLALILLCCHPALHPGARPPLALRLVMGTPTEEIARLFLVPRATMAARITRAKKKIVTAGVPLARPADQELSTRLDDVCRTVYLAFTAGYAPGSGPDLLRCDLATEAVDLAGLLVRLVGTGPMTHEHRSAAQVQGLYGLLLVQHARRDARVADGKLVTLADQDRSLWRHDEIAFGLELLNRLPTESATVYGEELRLQGLIASEHGRAATAADTDWHRIADLYRRLEVITGSAVVRLNRAVAVAEAAGPQAGLTLLDGLDDLLAAGHRLPAVRADLAARAGDTATAAESYRLAIDRCGNDVEREYLATRLRDLSR